MNRPAIYLFLLLFYPITGLSAGADLLKLGYGEITVDENGVARITFQRRFNHSAQTVWDAITNPSSRLRFFESADLREGGEVSIRFSDSLTEYCTITKLEPPHELVYVNNETHGHPARYFTDRLEITKAGEKSIVTFSTPLGLAGPVQLRIAAGWHVWIDNWQILLDDPTITRDKLDMSQTEREQRVLQPYIDQLTSLYPDWRAE